MQGRELVARDGDTALARTLLSTAGVQSLINYQDANGATPLFLAAQNGHASVTEQLIEVRCKVDETCRRWMVALFSGDGWLRTALHRGQKRPCIRHEAAH